MYKVVIATIITAIITGTTKAGPGWMCLSRDNRVGRCTTIRDCSHEYERNHRFRPVLCGVARYTIYICCPKPRSTYLPDLTYPGCGVQWRQSSAGGGRRKREDPVYMLNGEDPGAGKIWWIGLVYKHVNGHGTFTGGATVISPYFLLTAAHLFDSVDLSQTQISVKLGAHRQSDPGRTYPVNSTLLHPRYSSGGQNYDIALLRVNNRITFDNLVGPICLAVPQMALEEYLVGKEVKVQGYGQTYFAGPLSESLLQIDQVVTSNKNCSQAFQSINKTDIITSSMVCAQTPPGKNISDACMGDSGGPMTYLDPQSSRWYLLGVISFGVPCGSSLQLPGIYTRVSYFLEWIRQYTDLDVYNYRLQG